MGANGQSILVLPVMGKRCNMSDTKSNVVKIRIEGTQANVTEIARAIRARVQIVDESENVRLPKWNTVRRYLLALVGQDKQGE